MAGFLKLGDIKGESTDKEHKDWILVESLSFPVSRSIPVGARDMQRMRGDTTLGDVVVVRELDKSSTKLQEACANGTLFKEVEVHLTSQLGDKQEAYYKIKMDDVIISSYSFSGSAAGDPLPTEVVSLNYTKVEWTYVTLDPKTGDPKGKVVGSYDPGKGAAK